MKTGAPILRAMADAFPDDPACADPAHQAALGRQFMLGRSLLVVPSWTPDGTIECYVPEG